MGRFDHIRTPRLQVEVNLPGYDVRKSLADAQKRASRKRKLQRKSLSADPVPPAVEEPVTLGNPSALTAEDPQVCPSQPFTINL